MSREEDDELAAEGPELSQRFVKVNAARRAALVLAAQSSRRSREHYERHQEIRKGRAACTWCGKEPCGAVWTRPGEPVPGGERCCGHCSHEPVPGWEHTHTVWEGERRHPVCALVLKAGDVVYLRRDGVVHFLELGTDGEGLDGQPRRVPAVACLGREVDAALFRAGEGGVEDTNLWDRKAVLPETWLVARNFASGSELDARHDALTSEICEFEARREIEKAEQERLEDEMKAADRQKRALAHETVTVLREQVELGSDEHDTDEDPSAEMPLSAGAAEPERPIIDLRAPAPVVKRVGSAGVPKRSKRQREARRRQKLAQARQEAKARLEVKRLERLARVRGDDLIEKPQE